MQTKTPKERNGNMLCEFKINVGKDENGKFTSVSNREPDVCMADYVYLCMEALDTEELLEAMKRLRAFLTTTTAFSDLVKRVEGVERIIRNTPPEDDELVHDMACCWLSNLQRKLFQDLVGEYGED